MFPLIRNIWFWSKSEPYNYFRSLEQPSPSEDDGFLDEFGFLFAGSELFDLGELFA
jgi:hypothetical protein